MNSALTLPPIAASFRAKKWGTKVIVRANGNYIVAATGVIEVEGGVVMKQRDLGATGLTVSEIGMGTWELGGREWGDVNDHDAITLLRYAHDQGITFFDTSDQYGGGRVERLLGQAFAGRSSPPVIATKVGYEIDSDGWISRGARPPKFDASPAYLRSAVEGSLRRLGRQTIDLYQFHAPPPPEEWDDAFATMEELKAKGLIRSYGMALGSAAQALKAIQETNLSALMLSYHMLDRTMAQEVMPAAQSKGVGILVRQPLASGLLSGRLTPATVFAENDYRKTWSREKFLGDLKRVETIREALEIPPEALPGAALQFILAHPAVCSVVPGMMTSAQVDDGVRAAAKGPLTAERVARVMNIG